MNGFREFLAKEVARIGWREFVRRSNEEFTSGALQGWLRGALPLPSHQVAIAAIVDVPLEKIKDMVWRAEQAREEERQPRPFRALNGGQETRGGSARHHQARPAGARAAGRVRKPRRKGLGLLITGASLLALASAGYAQPASQVPVSNYAETQETRRILSSRRRAA